MLTVDLALAAGLAVLLFVCFLQHLCRQPELQVRVTWAGGPFSCDRTATPSRAPTKALLDRDVQEAVDKADEPITLVIDSLMLLRFFKFVCGDPSQVVHRDGHESFREVFHYCIGVPVSPTCRVVTHLLPVEFATQSHSGVRVADSSNIEALAALDEVGLVLAAHTHSHPGFGPGATHPSGIDRRFAERLWRGGHKAVGLIFSRDAFVRFFADPALPFTIKVHGNNIKKVEDNVFQLEVAKAKLPVEAPAL